MTILLISMDDYGLIVMKTSMITILVMIHIYNSFNEYFMGQQGWDVPLEICGCHTGH